MEKALEDLECLKEESFSPTEDERDCQATKQQFLEGCILCLEEADW